MNSSFKVLIPVALLMVVIFAVTYFSQYTPTEPDAKPAEMEVVKQPLQFFSTIRKWDPRNPSWDRFKWEKMKGATDRNGTPDYRWDMSLQDYAFPGYFETKELYSAEEQPKASYWFENRNPAPVTLALQKVTCMSCSGGRVTIFPATLARDILQMTALSTLPQGLVSGLPLGMALPAAQLDLAQNQVQTQLHKFDEDLKQIVYTIPPAPSGDPWQAQWGILELNFKPKTGGKPFTAAFFTHLEGSKDTAEDKFIIFYAQADPYVLQGTQIDVGELTENSAPQTHEILIYSSTRKLSVPPPIETQVRMPQGVGGEPGEFVSVGEARMVPEDRLELIALELSQAAKKPVRVLSAFLLPISVKVKVGNAKMDIGHLERVIHIAPDGTLPQQFLVKGTMRGPVSLAGSKAIDFGSFTSSDQQTTTVIVETERTGVELVLIPDLIQPKGLRVELTRLPNNGDRGAYRVKAVLPANLQVGDIRDGVVLLEAKGPNPQRRRIPVVGRGR